MQVIDRIALILAIIGGVNWGGAGLFRVGFVSTLAIGLHNFPEGVATFMAGYEDAALGVSIAIAIAMHNIPEGTSVAMPI